MTIHNERLIVVLDKQHSIKSATVFPIEWISETEARPLLPRNLVAGELESLAALVDAATVADRDNLAAQIVELEGERDALLQTHSGLQDQISALADERVTELEQFETQVSGLEATVAALEAELDLLKNPPFNPRHIAPFSFLKRFTKEERVAAFTSTDEELIDGLAQLQTIITFVDLDLTDTVNLILYMTMIGLLAPGRSDEILADSQPGEQ